MGRVFGGNLRAYVSIDLDRLDVLVRLQILDQFTVRGDSEFRFSLVMSARREL